MIRAGFLAQKTREEWASDGLRSVPMGAQKQVPPLHSPSLVPVGMTGDYPKLTTEDTEDTEEESAEAVEEGRYDVD